MPPKQSLWVAQNGSSRLVSWSWDTSHHSQSSMPVHSLQNTKVHMATEIHGVQPGTFINITHYTTTFTISFTSLLQLSYSRFRSSGDNCSRHLQAKCLSCHPSNSVKETKHNLRLIIKTSLFTKISKQLIKSGNTKIKQQHKMSPYNSQHLYIIQLHDRHHNNIQAQLFSISLDFFNNIPNA